MVCSFVGGVIGMGCKFDAGTKKNNMPMMKEANVYVDWPI